MSDFESLFFNPMVNFDGDNYNSKFRTETIEQLDKNEIIEIIKNNKPESFWNRYIQKYIQIDNIADRMGNIRKQRNKIAHNKYFSSEDQKSFIKDVKYISKKIDEAIEEIVNHDEKFNIRTMNIDLSSLKKIAELTEKITMRYAEIFAKTNIAGAFKKLESIQSAIPSFLFGNGEYENNDEGEDKDKNDDDLES